MAADPHSLKSGLNPPSSRLLAFLWNDVANGSGEILEYTAQQLMNQLGRNNSMALLSNMTFKRRLDLYEALAFGKDRESLSTIYHMDQINQSFAPFVDNLAHSRAGNAFNFFSTENTDRLEREWREAGHITVHFRIPCTPH